MKLNQLAEWDNDAQGLSWQSLPYLRSIDGNNHNETTSGSPAAASRSSPPPTGFTASSVHRYHSPERSSPSIDQELTAQPSTSTPLLVDRDFRTQFAERRRQEAASGGASSSSLTNPSSSYLGSLIATSLVNRPSRGGSRSLSPATRRLMMPQPPSQKRAESATTQPSSSSSSSGSSSSSPSSSGRPADYPGLNNPSPSRGTPNNHHQLNRTNYAHGQQQQPSVQSTSASGVFSLPNFLQTNHHLSALVDGSRQKGQNRT